MTASGKSRSKLFSLAAARVRRDRTAARYRPPTGLSVPIVTVLDGAGRILVEEQRAVVRYALQGAQIIFAAGTTGEWNRMDNSRRQLVARIAVEECRSAAAAGHAAEAWAGITAPTRAETLENLDHALEIAADAAVVAPLSIADVDNPVEFVTRDIGKLFERRGRTLPIYLYDNEDIAATGKSPHLHTRDVKRMSKLPYVHGVKVTSGKAVLGNYTRAAAHFKKSGDFAIYPGNAYLIFDLFRPRAGLRGRLRSGWNRYLTNGALPHGVVAGASNLMPREWRRAWEVCLASDFALMDRYGAIMEEFRQAVESPDKGKKRTIACLKAGLKHLGVISSDAVADGTPMLEADERRVFIRSFNELRRRACVTLEPEWLSHWAAPRPPTRRAALQDA